MKKEIEKAKKEKAKVRYFLLTLIEMDCVHCAHSACCACVSRRRNWGRNIWMNRRLQWKRNCNGLFVGLKLKFNFKFIQLMCSAHGWLIILCLTSIFSIYSYLHSWKQNTKVTGYLVYNVSLGQFTHNLHFH